jgi:hypothetical protein
VPTPKVPPAIFEDAEDGTGRQALALAITHELLAVSIKPQQAVGGTHPQHARVIDGKEAVHRRRWSCNESSGTLPFHLSCSREIELIGGKALGRRIEALKRLADQPQHAFGILDDGGHLLR